LHRWETPVKTRPLLGVGSRQDPYKKAPSPRGGVVQLVRTSPCHGEGRGFESRRSRHFFTTHPSENLRRAKERPASSGIFRELPLMQSRLRRFRDTGHAEFNLNIRRHSTVADTPTT
jgi:hypothetical protein